MFTQKWTCIHVHVTKTTMYMYITTRWWQLHHLLYYPDLEILVYWLELTHPPMRIPTAPIGITRWWQLHHLLYYPDLEILVYWLELTHPPMRIPTAPIGITRWWQLHHLLYYSDQEILVYWLELTHPPMRIPTAPIGITRWWQLHHLLYYPDQEILVYWLELTHPPMRIPTAPIGITRWWQLHHLLYYPNLEILGNWLEYTLYCPKMRSLVTNWQLIVTINELHHLLYGKPNSQYFTIFMHQSHYPVMMMNNTIVFTCLCNFFEFWFTFKHLQISLSNTTYELCIQDAMLKIAIVRTYMYLFTWMSGG